MRSPIRKVIQDLKFEIKIISRQLLTSKIKARRIVKTKFRKGEDLRLHLGSNTRYFDNWVNIDISDAADLVIDLRRNFPFPDNCVTNIFCEHMLEHLEYVDAKNFLAECYRILKPNCTIRIIVPDLEIFVKAYNRKDIVWFNSLKKKNDFQTGAEGLAFTFYSGGRHKFAWDYNTLEKNLIFTGFTKVQKTDYRKGSIDELNLERESELRAAHSLCVNATK